MRYHGNFCGPNWSDGKHQASVVPTLPPIDHNDNCCREHDRAYATGADHGEADRNFIQCLDNSLDGWVMATAVRMNNLFNMPNLRTNKPKPNKPMATRSDTAVAVPAAIGRILRPIKPIIKRATNSARVIGREFAGNLAPGALTPAAGLYVPVLSIPLNPAYYQSAVLGMHAKSFDLFKFHRVTVRYLPQCGTDSPGSVVMITSKNIREPFLDSTGNFLPRALTQSNAVLGPVWHELDTVIDCDNEWRKVDLFTATDIQDNVLEEIQIYASGYVATDSLGIFVIDYDVEFKDPIYQPHASLIPDSIGPSQIFSFNTQAIGTVNDALTLSNPATFPTYGDGAIFRAALRSFASSAPTGATLANMVNIGETRYTTAVAFNVDLTAINLRDGFTCYLRRGGGATPTYRLYASLASAQAGQSEGLILVRTAWTAAGTLVFIVQHVSMSPPFTTVIQG